MSQSDVLSVEAFAEAARSRAVRTTDALILAEGQIIDLRRQLDQLAAERDQYATEAGKLREMRARRRLRDRARRARKRAKAEPCPEPGCRCHLRAEGVDDATEDADPIGYTGAVGQAD